MTRSRAGEPQVHGITGAQAPHSDDLDQRVGRYLVSMGIRTACVILVLVVQGPFRWVFAVGAVVLPYIAVILANNTGGRRPTPTATLGDQRPRRPSLEASSTTRTGATVDAGEVLEPDIVIPARAAPGGSSGAV